MGLVCPLQRVLHCRFKARSGRPILNWEHLCVAMVMSFFIHKALSVF